MEIRNAAKSNITLPDDSVLSPGESCDLSVMHIPNPGMLAFISAGLVTCSADDLRKEIKTLSKEQTQEISQYRSQISDLISLLSAEAK